MNKKQASFTFVELLVVVTIFSILSLAVYATFSSGMRMWARIQESTFAQRIAILRLEKISQDLRQSLDFSKIGFTATEAGEISFPILSTNNEISRVTYFLKDKVLFRKLERFKDILEEKAEAEEKKLLFEVEDLKFSFGYQKEGKYVWKTTWDSKEEGLPITVKIELKVKDADFTKTVTIPVS